MTKGPARSHPLLRAGGAEPARRKEGRVEASPGEGALSPDNCGMKLSVVLVNWNTAELLGQCLDSLFSQDLSAPFEVIVVDNASTDGSVDMVRRQFPRVDLVVAAENLGFTKANNLALEKASGEYVLLLNPDTVMPDRHTLAAWLRFMDEHPQASASGCRLIFPDGSHQVGDAGFRPTLASVASYALFLSKIVPGVKTLYLNYSGFRGPMEVDWICGADFLVRRSILPEVGMMDESIFLYADDVEWGCRMRASGHRIFYLPGLSIVHLQGATRAAPVNGGLSFAWLENMRSLYGRYNSGKGLVLFDILFCVNFALRAALYKLWFMASRDQKAREKGRRMGQYLKLVLAHFPNTGTSP